MPKAQVGVKRGERIAGDQDGEDRRQETGDRRQNTRGNGRTGDIAYGVERIAYRQ